MSPTSAQRAIDRFALLALLATSCAPSVSVSPQHHGLALRDPNHATTRIRTNTMPTPSTIVPQLDTLVAALVEGRWIHGMAIGLVSGDEDTVVTYGHARDDGPPPDEHTLFEIGSVTKTFTGLLLSDLLARGDVAIDTAVQSLLPPGVHAPTNAEHPERPMLLLDLATHRAGLPRLPPGMPMRDPADPYAAFHETQLLESLARTPLVEVPGAAYEFSNYGYALLGWLEARRAGRTYAQLVAARIAAPLGLEDTHVGGADETRPARLAQPHDADDDVVMPWQQDAMAPAGAIRSTMRDMIRYVRANIAPSGVLADALTRSHVLRHQITTPPGYVTLGWHVQRDRNTYWHNGETGGSHAYVAFDPRQGIGVVVLANTASTHVDEVGLAAMRLLRGHAVSPIALPPSVTLDDTQLERLAGTYRFAAGVPLVVTHTPGVLRVRLATQPALRVHPTSATECRYRIVDASLTFEMGADGRASAVVLHQGGVDQRAARVE